MKVLLLEHLFILANLGCSATISRTKGLGACYLRKCRTICFNLRGFQMKVAPAMFRRNGILILSLMVSFWVGCGGSSNTINTVAGKNFAGFQGDGGEATSALLRLPSDVAVDSAGNFFIADTDNNRIRKVTDGIISTVVGDGFSGYTGDGGPATAARLNQPVSIAIDSGGNLYIADLANHAIRKVDSAGTITTIAGSGTPGFNGDNIAATTAVLSLPSGVAVDSGGNVFISDSGNNRIREIVAASGLIQTVAGTGAPGFSGDSGPATSAMISAPSRIALGGSNDLYIADTGNDVVRKVSSGTITTVAGSQVPGNAGDGGIATKATISNPVGVAVDQSGNLYLSDPVNSRVRKVSNNGTISAAAGTGQAGFTGDGSGATAAELNGPQGLAVDSRGNLYIADARNQVVRKVSF